MTSETGLRKCSKKKNPRHGEERELVDGNWARNRSEGDDAHQPLVSFVLD